MKKFVKSYFPRGKVLKCIIMVKLVWIILLASVLQITAGTAESYSQVTRMDLRFKNTDLESVIWEIKKQTDFNFFYNSDDIQAVDEINLNMTEATVEEVLSQVLAKTGLTFEVVHKTVIIRKDDRIASRPAALPVQQPQSREISGIITDTEGMPLPGVSVFIVGTTIGTVTKANGEFSLEVPINSRALQVSFVGMKTQEVLIGDRTRFALIMEEETVGIEEVVAIGYGGQKKRDISGSIASVKSENIENTPVKDVMSVLQGRAPGVQVVSNSGAPGDGISVTVRGQSSLNSGNDPLYVIDGVPVESVSLSQLNGWEQHGVNPLSDINPRDIESIEVLKDGASTAIYGSRAANGVILITTKRGKEGKASVNLNFYSGVSKITRFLSVLNASQWRQIIIDTYTNLDAYNNAVNPSEPHWTAIDSLNPMNSGDVDWQDVMYRTAWQKQMDFSVVGGNQGARYSYSASVLDQDGIFLASNYKRITSRLNAEFTVSPMLQIGYNFSFARGLNNRINAGGTGNNSLVQSILVRPPVYSLTYPDGSPINYFSGKRNPVGLARECTHLNATNRLIGNQYVDFQILEGLRFRTNVSLDFYSHERGRVLSDHRRLPGWL